MRFLFAWRTAVAAAASIRICFGYFSEICYLNLYHRFRECILTDFKWLSFSLNVDFVVSRFTAHTHWLKILETRESTKSLYDSEFDIRKTARRLRLYFLFFRFAVFSLHIDSSRIVSRRNLSSPSRTFSDRKTMRGRERERNRAHDIFSANSKSLLLRSRSCELFERWTDDAQMCAKWSHWISWMNKSSSRTRLGFHLLFIYVFTLYSAPRSLSSWSCLKSFSLKYSTLLRLSMLFLIRTHRHIRNHAVRVFIAFPLALLSSQHKSRATSPSQSLRSAGQFYHFCWHLIGFMYFAHD